MTVKLSTTLKEQCGLRVFETGVWRKYLGPRGMRMGRRLHNEELISLYRSPNIVRFIKYRRLRWAEKISRME
jgi:hypothetical protein